LHAIFKTMNRFFALLFLIFSLSSTHAQIHEIGLFLGGSNYIGDIGPTTYVSPNEPAIGIIYKWNKSPRHSWRISYTQAKITSNDKDSDVPARKLRGYSFKNDIKELSLGLEFNFFDFNLHEESKVKVTPYVFSGLSYVQYNGLFFVGDASRYDTSHGTLAIPMTLGIKARIFPHMILGIESSAKYTFADDLDGSNPTNENLDGLGFGNLNSKDWFVFTGLTLTYTFGNKPCYCAD